MNKIFDEASVGELVVHQLRSYWTDIDEKAIKKQIPIALKMIDENFKDIKSNRFSQKGQGLFNPYFSSHWMIFLQRLSNILYKCGGGIAADQLYYLNKIMHSVDWYCAVDLPVHFLCEHPLGSVLGRAQYGDWFLVYQGTTVGGSRKNRILYYPIMGDHIIMFSNASVIGKSIIGSNVIIASGTRIVNETIPSNCIVFGESPHLIIKEYNSKEMKARIEEYWK